MYKNTHAIIRHDLNAFVEEAAQIDKLLFGDRLLPILPVEARAGIYPKIEIGGGGELLKKDSTLRGPTGTYNETTRQFVTDQYECLDRGIEERIDDVVVRDYNKFFDVEVLTAKLITRHMKLDYESRVYDLLLQAAASGFLYLQIDDVSAGAAGEKYSPSNHAFGSSDGLGTIDYALVLMDAIKELTKRGETPNTIVFGRDCWNHIRRSTKLNTFLYGKLGTGDGYKLVNEQDIAKHFGVQNVYIAGAHIDSAARQGTQSLTPLWNNDKIWIGDVAGGEVSGGGAGRTFVWSKDGTGLYTTETYRSEPRRGDMVRVRHHTAEKMVNKNAGIVVAMATAASAANSITWA